MHSCVRINVNADSLLKREKCTKRHTMRMKSYKVYYCMSSLYIKIIINMRIMIIYHDNRTISSLMKSQNLIRFLFDGQNQRMEELFQKYQMITMWSSGECICHVERRPGIKYINLHLFHLTFFLSVNIYILWFCAALVKIHSCAANNRRRDSWIPLKSFLEETALIYIYTEPNWMICNAQRLHADIEIPN